ncbi:MAG: aspartyl-phosphate phosphatase Spo0E family protein [Clostridioides sp.]|jgi:uncharacterized coiled-coil DUF342 family protein|nr:aspartyl-phosphate phosphatase Spo0E family protein [Clostridioides sp.]
MITNQMEKLSTEIESVRDRLNKYIEYPEIFKDELVETSKKIDKLMNKYMELQKATQHEGAKVNNENQEKLNLGSKEANSK